MSLRLATAIGTGYSRVGAGPDGRGRMTSRGGDDSVAGVTMPGCAPQLKQRTPFSEPGEIAIGPPHLWQKRLARRRA